MINDFRDTEINTDINEIVKDNETISNDNRKRITAATQRTSSLFKKLLITSIILVLSTMFIYIFMTTDNSNRSEVVVDSRDELKSINGRIETLSNSLASSYDELRGRIDQLEYDMANLNEKIDGQVAKRGSTKAEKKNTGTSAATRYHIVRRGENTYRIALRYGLTLDQLCKLNNIAKNDIVRPGQKLIVR